MRHWIVWLVGGLRIKVRAMAPDNADENFVTFRDRAGKFVASFHANEVMGMADSRHLVDSCCWFTDDEPERKAVELAPFVPAPEQSPEQA